jgi:hypothetical protein
VQAAITRLRAQAWRGAPLDRPTGDGDDRRDETRRAPILEPLRLTAVRLLEVRMQGYVTARADHRHGRRTQRRRSGSTPASCRSQR